MNPLSRTSTQSRSLTHYSMPNNLLENMVTWLPLSDLISCRRADKRFNGLLATDKLKGILKTFVETISSVSTLRSKPRRVRVESRIFDHAAHVAANDNFSVIFSSLDHLCIIKAVNSQSKRLVENVFHVGNLNNTHAFFWAFGRDALIPLDLQTGKECRPVNVTVAGRETMDPLVHAHRHLVGRTAFQQRSSFFLLKNGTLCVVTNFGDVCSLRISSTELVLLDIQSLRDPTTPVKEVETVDAQHMPDGELRLLVKFSLNKAPPYDGAPPPFGSKIVYYQEGRITIKQLSLRYYDVNSKDKNAPEAAFYQVARERFANQLTLTASSIEGESVTDHWKQHLDLPIENGKFQHEYLQVSKQVNSLIVVIASSYKESPVKVDLFDKKTGRKISTLKNVHPSTPNCVWLQPSLLAVGVEKAIICWNLSQGGISKLNVPTEADSKEREGAVTDVCFVSPRDIRVLLQLSPLQGSDEEDEEGSGDDLNDNPGDDLYLVRYTSAQQSSNQSNGSNSASQSSSSNAAPVQEHKKKPRTK